MLPYFAIMLTALLGFCGLAVDVGRMELRQVQLQTAADAAALSAAAELQHANPSWQAAASTEAANSAALNNFPMPTVAVQQGATLGAYAADNSTVQVTLTEPVATIFLGLLGSATRKATITAKAVAMIPPCVFLMGPPTRGQAELALSSQGFNNLHCPMYAKSAYFVDGFSHICCTTPKTSGPAADSVMTGWTYPAIQYNSPVLKDPLAYIPAPAFQKCDYNGVGSTIPTPAILHPGTYCGSLQIVGTTATLLPGLYIITGGMTVDHSTLTGSGVTLYFTQGGGAGFGIVYINHSTMTLSAPVDQSAGGIPAILFFGDRAWAGGTTDFRIVFSSNYGDGIFYTTNTGLYSWISNWSAPNYFTMITGNLSPQDSGLIFSANYSLLPTGDPLRMPVVLVQ